MKLISQNEYSEVANMYYEGLSQQKIANHYGVSQSQIWRILKEMGVQSRDVRRLSIKQEIIDRYVNGDSTIQIAKDLNTTRKHIRNVLRRNNIEMRSLSEATRKYNFNEHYFDVIDTPNKAYILGLLDSDGCNGRNNDVKIKLQERDRDILEKVNVELSNEKPLLFLDGAKDGHQNTFTLSFTSPYTSEILEALGCTHSKSLTLKFPKYLDESLYPHFIRGYFDGDGHISKDKHKQQFSLTGTFSFLSDVALILQEQCRCHCRIREKVAHEDGDDTYELIVVKNGGARAVFDYIYKDAELYMQRKYDIYKSIYCDNT